MIIRLLFLRFCVHGFAGVLDLGMDDSFATNLLIEHTSDEHFFSYFFRIGGRILAGIATIRYSSLSVGAGKRRADIGILGMDGIFRK